MAKEDGLACVGSVSSRVTELVREQEKWKTKGGRGGGKEIACLQTPRFWKTPLDILRFGSFLN